MNTDPQKYEPMSTSDFAAFGMQQIAYVKAVETDGKTSYEVHAADGTPLTAMADRDSAFVVIRQNDLEPLSAH